jgi:predicted HicB family RNase H-like nuclease
MLQQKTKSHRFSITIPLWLKTELNCLANDKFITLNDYVKDVLKTEVNRANQEKDTANIDS